MKRTFLDSGVLIAAVRQDHPFDDRIDRLLLDPERVFLSSAFVRLEVLPKAVFHKRADHVAWFELFFDSLAGWADATPASIAQAEQIAADHGLSALDALHVVAATALGAANWSPPSGRRSRSTGQPGWRSSRCAPRAAATARQPRRPPLSRGSRAGPGMGVL